MDRGAVAGLLVLVLLTAGSFWLNEVVAPEEPVRRASHRQDSYMEDFRVTHMNEDGTLRNRLWGERMVHFPDDDSTELEQPRMLIFRTDAPPWQVISERGWVSSGGDLVLLRGKVHLHREAGMGRGPVWVDTTDMRVRPDEDYADTDSYAVIRSDVVHMTGIGMRAYLKDGRLQLLNDVHGRYESNKS